MKTVAAIRIEWETEIIWLVQKALDCTTSDAQGIIEAQPFKMQQAWGRGKDAIDAAGLILATTC